MKQRLLPHEPGKRQCLKCSTMFDSSGAANRICAKCSKVNAALRVSEAQLARERGAKYLNGNLLEKSESYEMNFA